MRRALPPNPQQIPSPSIHTLQRRSLGLPRAQRSQQVTEQRALRLLEDRGFLRLRVCG